MFILVLSVFIFFGIIIINLEIFFYYCINETVFKFFIIDFNLVAFWFFYRITYEAYFLYRPFFRVITKFIFRSQTVYTLHALFKRIFIRAVYCHYSSRFINTFDFSIHFMQIFSNFSIESFDIVFFIRQYIGSFFDFFFRIRYLHMVLLFILQKPKIIKYRVYDISITNVFSFWEVFYSTWTFRFVWYIFIFYFFGAEPRFNDLIRLLFGIFFVEMIVITSRVLFSIQKII